RGALPRAPRLRHPAARHRRARERAPHPALAGAAAGRDLRRLVPRPARPPAQAHRRRARRHRARPGLGPRAAQAPAAASQTDGDREMNLGVIDKDEYRQYRYWQAFQKLLLPCAAGFTVAGAVLDGHDLRVLSQIVAGLLWLFFVAAAFAAYLVARHMVRELPASLQSLLLFSTESGDEAPAAERLVQAQAQPQSE